MNTPEPKRKVKKDPPHISAGRSARAWSGGDDGHRDLSPVKIAGSLTVLAESALCSTISQREKEKDTVRSRRNMGPRQEPPDMRWRVTQALHEAVVWSLVLVFAVQKMGSTVLSIGVKCVTIWFYLWMAAFHLWIQCCLMGLEWVPGGAAVVSTLNRRMASGRLRISRAASQWSHIDGSSRETSAVDGSHDSDGDSNEAIQSSFLNQVGLWLRALYALLMATVNWTLVLLHPSSIGRAFGKARQMSELMLALTVDFVSDIATLVDYAIATVMRGV